MWARWQAKTCLREQNMHVSNEWMPSDPKQVAAMTQPGPDGPILVKD